MPLGSAVSGTGVAAAAAGVLAGGKRQRCQLRNLVYLVQTEQGGAVASEARGLEFLGNIKMTGLAASDRDQVPLRVVRTFGATKPYPIKNVLAIRRHRDGMRVVQRGGIIEGERMARALCGGRNRNGEQQSECKHSIAHVAISNRTEAYQRAKHKIYRRVAWAKPLLVVYLAIKCSPIFSGRRSA